VQVIGHDDVAADPNSVLASASREGEEGFMKSRARENRAAFGGAGGEEVDGVVREK
jgi:hypothetical protein